MENYLVVSTHREEWNSDVVEANSEKAAIEFIKKQRPDHSVHAISQSSILQRFSAIERPITDRQEEILSYIAAYTRSNGYPPVVREIQEHFEFKSPNAVQVQLRSLERKGYLSKGPNKSRTMRVMKLPKSHKV